MKLTTLPVKRRLAAKSLFKRLSAVTGSRRQRVAATATSEMEGEDSSAKISRALMFIFLIHIVAIALIFIHKQFLDGRPNDEVAKPKIETSAVATTPVRDLGLAKLAAGERGVLVKPGDNYVRIAQAEGVDEQDLRLLNKHAEIRPGMVILVPPKRVVALEPPEVAAIRERTPVDRNEGMIELAVAAAPRAQLIRPAIHPVPAAAGHDSAPAAVVPSGKTYIFEDGDSIWKIANHFKVSQDQLMKANGITNARKIKTGTKLIIPR
jgi:nucleoid-associated protein YgaU